MKIYSINLKFISLVSKVSYRGLARRERALEAKRGSLLQWNDISELKDLLQHQWSEIKQFEIRARIAELPARCQTILDTGGKRIRSARW